MEKSLANKKFGLVIMASGLGKRFGGNKLMEELDGKPLISYVLRATAGLFFKTVVVTRNDEVETFCRAQGVEVVKHSLPYRSDTVRLGIGRMDGCQACMFSPADQPLISRESVAKMLEAAAADGESIFRLGFGEKVGAPILFPAPYFEELAALPEGKGGSYVARNHPAALRTIAASSEIELFDIDTVEDMEYIKKVVSG